MWCQKLTCSAGNRENARLIDWPSSWIINSETTNQNDVQETATVTCGGGQFHQLSFKMRRCLLWTFVCVGSSASAATLWLLIRSENPGQIGNHRRQRVSTLCGYEQAASAAATGPKEMNINRWNKSPQSSRLHQRWDFNTAAPREGFSHTILFLLVIILWWLVVKSLLCLDPISIFVVFCSDRPLWGGIKASLRLPLHSTKRQ